MARSVYNVGIYTDTIEEQFDTEFPETDIRDYGLSPEHSSIWDIRMRGILLLHNYSYCCRCVFALSGQTTVCDTSTGRQREAT